MSTALAEVPRQDVSLEFSQLFNYWQRLEEFEETVINLLPFGSDEEIQETKRYAHEMGSAGWRIVCACDAILLQRATALKGGRGKVDTEGVGKLGAAKKEAKKRDVSDRTIRRNAQIHRLVKTVENDHHSLLDDKGYFEAALRAPDSKKAVRIFEKEKSENPNFSVRDAMRLAKKLKENRKKVEIPDEVNYLDPQFKNFLIDLENTLTSFKNRCPRPEFVIRIESMIKTTRFERARTPQSDYEAVRKQVDEGACTTEEIAEEVYLSHAEIKKICGQIIEKEPETYELRPIGANTEQARGSRAQGLFRKDAPSGDDFEIPHNGYNPTVEWGEE